MPFTFQTRYGLTAGDSVTWLVVSPERSSGSSIKRWLADLAVPDSIRFSVSFIFFSFFFWSFYRIIGGGGGVLWRYLYMFPPK